jgi:hypothetical protein
MSMRSAELADLLTASGVPSWAFSIGDLKDGADCLLREGNIWVTFFFEKGLRYDEEVFQAESAACEFLLKKLREVNFRSGGRN